MSDQSAEQAHIAYEPCDQPGHNHDWRDCPVPEATPSETDVLELRLCETEFLVLRADRLYRFTVDEGCKRCLALHATYESERAVTSPEQPSEEGVAREQYGRPPGCICPMFRDTGGYRIADLTCPVHGVHGTDPGDGYWESREEEDSG